MLFRSGIASVKHYAGEDGSYVMTDADREYLANNPYLQRSRNLGSGIADALAPLGQLRNWDPLQSGYKAYQQFIGQPFANWVNQPAQDQMAIWETGRKARTGEIPTFVGTEPTEKGKMVNAGLMTSDQTVAQAKAAAAANAPVVAPAAAPVAQPSADATDLSKAEPKSDSKLSDTLEKVTPTPESDFVAKMRQKIGRAHV